MRPFCLGLTGSIGMGKSTTARMFRAEGIPVWDADEAVGRLYSVGGRAVEMISSLRPEAVSGGAVNREALKAWIEAEPAALQKIEAVVHPLVAADRHQFVTTCAADIVVLDVPLLFETGADQTMDATLVVTAPWELQRARVLSRPGMSEKLFKTILEKQLPDHEKRARATHIIETLGLAAVEASVRALISYIRETQNA
jgi:dephospho-CoA kinase